jgi:hypothetical protein
MHNRMHDELVITPCEETGAVPRFEGSKSAFTNGDDPRGTQ